MNEGYARFTADIEDGYPRELTIRRHLDFEDDGRIAADWYQLELCLSPTANLALLADGLDALDALAQQLTAALVVRREKDAAFAARRQGFREGD